MKTENNNKKKALAITAAIVALLVIAGTFMWFTADDKVTNEFALDRFDVRITEKFEPQPVEPGATIDKEVGVVNNSNIPAVVRVKLQEELFVPVLGSDGKPSVKYRTTAGVTSSDTNIVIVKISQPEIDNLAGSGYVALTDNPVTGSALPANVSLYSRTVPRTDGSGTDTQYVCFVTDSHQLAQFNAISGEITYGYFSRNELQGGPFFHGTANDLPSPYHPDQIKPNMINQVAPGSSTAGWFLDANTGYYYYSRAVAPGEQALPLMSSVSFDVDLDDSMQGALYKLTPIMEATQFASGAITEWTDRPSPLSIFDINGANPITLP